MSKIVSIIVILFSISTFSQTTISGNIGDMTFTPSGNPWIVTENIIVEKDKTVRIKQDVYSCSSSLPVWMCTEN